MSIVRFGRQGMLLAAAVLMMTACKDSTSASGPHGITVVAGDNQQVKTDSPAETALKVQIVNDQGAGVAGVTVTWTIVSGDGTLSTQTSTTDDKGYATITFTAGDNIETTTVQAKAGSFDAIFKLFVVPA